MQIRTLAIAGLLAIGASSSAFAQCQGNPPAGRICANGTAAPTLPSWYTQSVVLDRNFGAPSVQGTILNRGASLWSATASPALGLNGTAGGSLTLNGSSTGSAVIGVKAAAGSVTFNLPITNGSLNNVLISDGSGNTSWASAGSGTTSSVGLALPASILTVSGSPVTTTGTLTGTLATQSKNLVWAGPTAGADATPTFRSLVGADLPNPTSGTLGGIESLAAVSSNWIRAISTSGVPSASQPAFTDISGTLAAAQCPNPSASTIGCVESLAAVTSKWINTISTGGVPSSSQPAFSDISGNVSLGQLPPIGSNSILSNITGGSSTPLANSLTSIIDSSIASTQGDIIYRDTAAWLALAPGTMGQVLTSGGAAANPSWTTVSGTGTVTSVATGTGLTGGPITASGTVSFANIADQRILANITGGSAVPSANTMTAIIDETLGSTEGDVLYRGASVWAVLGPGSNGQFLQTTGAGSTPQWASASAISGSPTGGQIAQWTNSTTVKGVASSSFASGGFLNKFRNGTMDVWQRGTSGTAAASLAVPCVAIPDGWCVVQTGAQFACVQGTGNAGTTFSLSCVGGTSNTDTKYTQRIESFVAEPLAGNTVTVQFQYFQSSGSTITPKVSTCFASATDDFTTCTADLAATSLTACNTATWCTEAYTLAVSSSASKGYSVTLDCNTALTAAESCLMTAADIRVTTGISTGVNTSPPPAELRPISVELLLNRRYYFQTTGTANSQPTFYGFGTSGTTIGGAYPFSTPMRITPSTTVTGSFALTNCATPTIAGEDTSSYLAVCVANSVTAAATSFQPNGSAVAKFSAEL